MNQTPQLNKINQMRPIIRLFFSMVLWILAISCDPGMVPVPTPPEVCFNPKERIDFNFDFEIPGAVISCPTNNQEPCKITVKGTLSHQMQCEATYLYLLIRSKIPPENPWHIQPQPFERVLPQPEADGISDWEIIIQYGGLGQYAPQDGNQFELKAILTKNRINQKTIDDIKDLKDKGIEVIELDSRTIDVQKTSCFSQAQIKNIRILQVDNQFIQTTFPYECGSTLKPCRLEAEGKVELSDATCGLFVHLLVRAIDKWNIQQSPVELDDSGNWNAFAWLGSEEVPPLQQDEFDLVAIVSSERDAISDLREVDAIGDIKNKYRIDFERSTNHRVIVYRSPTGVSFSLMTDFSILVPNHDVQVDCPTDENTPCRLEIRGKSLGLNQQDANHASILTLVQPFGNNLKWFVQLDEAVQNAEGKVDDWRGIAQLGGTSDMAPMDGDQFKLVAILTVNGNEIKELGSFESISSIPYPILATKEVVVTVNK